MERRFACVDCHLKWFVPVARPRTEDPTGCPSCHGRLLALDAMPEMGSSPAGGTGSSHHFARRSSSILTAD